MARPRRATGSPSPSRRRRWTGEILPQFSETYTFSTRSDDGIRLWIDDVRIISNWTTHAPTVNTGTRALTAGVRARIRIEYCEKTGGAVARLEWSSPSRPREVVPQARLFSGPSGVGMLMPGRRPGTLPAWLAPAGPLPWPAGE